MRISAGGPVTTEAGGSRRCFRPRFHGVCPRQVNSDDRRAPGIEIGRAGTTYRRIRTESGFGKVLVLVTDGHLPYPFGREMTGY